MQALYSWVNKQKLGSIALLALILIVVLPLTLDIFR